MSVDWSKTYKGALRGKRGKYNSYAEMLQEQHSKMEEIKKANDDFKRIEPVLRKSLLDHMVNRLPIRVVRPIQYFTEEVQKSETGANFTTGMAVIPGGTELTFLRIDKTMGQWIFKSQDGKEYEIYDTPLVMIPGGAGQPSRQVVNSGFYGLLCNTHIYQTVAQAVGDE